MNFHTVKKRNYIMRENISWNQLCAINEKNDFTDFRKLFFFFVSIEFDKTFVRATFLLMSRFHEIIFQWERISRFSSLWTVIFTVWKFKNFSAKHFYVKSIFVNWKHEQLHMILTILEARNCDFSQIWFHEKYCWQNNSVFSTLWPCNLPLCE